MRKPLSTKIEDKLQKEVKKLAIDLEKPLNILLEEAIQDLLSKYNDSSRISETTTERVEDKKELLSGRMPRKINI